MLGRSRATDGVVFYAVYTTLVFMGYGNARRAECSASTVVKDMRLSGRGHHVPRLQIVLLLTGKTSGVLRDSDSL